MNLLKYLLKIPGLQKALAYFQSYFIVLVNKMLVFWGHNKKKGGFIFEIQRKHNHKEDDSPPANNKVTEILADGLLQC